MKLFIEALRIIWDATKGAANDAPWVFWPLIAIIVFAIVSAL